MKINKIPNNSIRVTINVRHRFIPEADTKGNKNHSILKHFIIPRDNVITVKCKVYLLMH